MPIHGLVLVLTQAKSSLLIATTTAGLASINLFQKPDFLLVHTAHLWYTGMGAAPCSEKTQKVLKKTSKWRHPSSWDQDPRTF